MNHVLLQNLQFWRPLEGYQGGLLRHLARMEGAWGTNNITKYDLLSYLEVAPAANLLYPSGIRFLIAAFNTLFGTTIGAKLRLWASDRGWILLWSLGLNTQTELAFMDLIGPIGVNTTANQRIIDPVVAVNTTASKGLSVDAGTRNAFEKRWAAARRLRTWKPSVGNETWLAQWKQLRDAIPQDLQVSPARARAGCPRPGPGVPECVGITATGKCVCYEQQQLLQDDMNQQQQQQKEKEVDEEAVESLIVA